MTDVAERYGPWAVIAGASEGIGACLADELGSRGVHLVLIARNAVLLEEVAAGVRERHGVEVRSVVLDLTVDDLEQRVASATDGLEVGLVVYNAGASDRTSDFLDNELDYSLHQIALDCVGPVVLARHFGPAMRGRGRGGIVLVASLACVAGSATLAMYSGVKAFQHNFGEGLWAELEPHGVDVCVMPLGMTYTPALRRMGLEYDPRAHMTSEDVAREIVENVGNGPVHVVGENNRAVAAQVWTIDRRALVEMMSIASKDFADKRSTS
ncbi:SDR family NAD(P)-dependent oxidoreductase [Mycolicibacterium sediminis]|uniref:Short-chain dehydrogenase n=1 Tax=Mycolicibacterium sediminis TaxID=1286180 RepID=A0A7I7QX55_9MYCO|nr:SDR family NAD(P)-dependent oxidoreductase [Mycolicibacterium sediminis]BBY30921.1 short-chain dehydrogenase [Mycolicibacterium sediminis]